MSDRNHDNQVMGKGSPALPPAHDIFLHVQGGGWQNCLPAVETFVSETALAVLSLEWAKASSTELSVVLAEDAFVRELNMTYRDQPNATNVLSFPALKGDLVREIRFPGDAPVLLGDVVLAFETCVLEAQVLDAAAPFADHTRHLLVHGILHLLGYDHEDDFDARQMEAREVRILAAFGVADPYH